MIKVSNPYIIDIEASGFGHDSYPIEIGLALNQEDRYCSLVKPQPDWTHWDMGAEETHHIPRNLIETRGKPAAVVAHELNSLLGEGFVFSDGSVVDVPWITKLYQAARTTRSFQIYDLQTILSEKQMREWHTCKTQVLEELNIERHRASNDARVIQETFRRTL